MTQYSYHADKLQEAYANAEDALDTSNYWLTQVYMHWAAGDDHTAIYELWVAVGWTNSISYYMLDKYAAYSPYYRLCKIHTTAWEYTEWEIPEFELTWKAICEAWVKDDFEGMEWTIACIDHMRKLMWDKPFKIQWAEKPTGES